MGFSYLTAATISVFAFGATSERDTSSSIIVTTSNGALYAHVVLLIENATPVSKHYTEHLTRQNIVGRTRAADRRSNAWTSNYAVCYWLSGARDDLPDLLKTLSGVFAPIDLPRTFAAEEREIILREYEHRMANNPDAQAIGVMDAFIYLGNAIAASAMGTPKEIAALDYEEAKALHAMTHVPEIAPPPFGLAAPDTTKLRYPEPDAARRLIWRRVVALPEPVQFDLLETQTALLRDMLDTNLPGELAYPFRFDAAIARSFDVQIWPIDEKAIGISFTAAPDRNVPLDALQKAFETTLAESAAAGISPETYSRIFSRFEGFWPDWDDEDETARWIADYTLNRVSSLREPLPERDLNFSRTVCHSTPSQRALAPA